ncbi:hypothetical protein HO133_002028 [Letharia lupina]|uniref:Fungal N-terminal domain-containing protein n=1 Tax=Letharia lupina TaxID=560253 RepID=A0A8H6CD07_9LECA|nr:uncharacterized protein HO133_002028 [Letharia lupina]KAF6221174.1 hypothetical protein HO133_002028 [Letharia lupina]
MDPLSVATSVAGVAATGLQLSQTIYDLISTFYEAEREMSSIANDISLLATVLHQLEGVLRRDSRVYQPRMVEVVHEILDTCEDVFQSISKFISRHRVRPLQAGLESMKSTLNVLLHVVQLARATEAAKFFIPNAGTVFTQADIRKESRMLVGVVLENRRSILSLKQIEEDRDRRQNLRNIIENKRDSEGTDSDVALDDGAPKTERKARPTERTNIGGFSSVGGWAGGGSANTSTHMDSFSKAAKDSATDTTYSNKENKKKTTTTGLDSGFGIWGPREEGNEVEEAEEIKARGEDGWVTFTTTTTTEKEHKKNAWLNDVSKNPNPTVIDNAPENTVAAADGSWSAWGVASNEDKEAKEKMEERKNIQKGVEDNNRRSRDVSPDLSVPARSSSHSEHIVQDYKVSEAGSGGSRLISVNESPDLVHADSASISQPSHSGIHSDPQSQSPASVHYFIAPEIPLADDTVHSPMEDLAMEPSGPQITASTKGLDTKFGKSQWSPPETEIVTPTAQWFLSVVPHESSVTALIVRPRPGDANHLRTRAEETAKTLLLNWTTVDPGVISGEESFWNSGRWNSTNDSYFYPHRPARDENVPTQPYHVPYPHQSYPTYTPQQWYAPPVFPPLPSPPVFTPLPPPLPVTTPSPPPEDKQTDSEELARLKKLILDEKAEQDERAAAAAAAAAVPPSTAAVVSIATEDTSEDAMQRENNYTEAVDSVQRQQVHITPWKAEPSRQQPVIMRDWFGRKFIFPVDMCQTWEGLHNLIQEAFGHELKHRSMVEKGYYNISHVTGEIILPSIWELFVRPGLEINMELQDVLDADLDDSGGKAMVGGRREKTGPKTLTPPHAPEVPTLGSPMVLQSRSDEEASINDVANDEADYSVPDGISYVELSDPRYLSIEKVLLEQKMAKVEAEMKLERNRRFFQLKQQLMDQGAAIHARQDAADHAEQDNKLAWLEKQVRDQKEVLDGLPPLLMTPPSSNAGDSLSKSPSSPQRNPSFVARLLGRIPSRSIRSRGSIQSQQMITEG